MKTKILFLFILTAAAFASCDEGTASLGISAIVDEVSDTTVVYPVYTRTVLMDSGIVANNSNCYLGRITDPETGCTIEADFAAQFQTFENYSYPDKKYMVDATDTTNIKHGVVKCDGCEVRLYFDSYSGDANNSMKLQVFELSANPDKALCEDSIYTTDVDLSAFLDEGAEPIASRFFSVADYDVPESDRNSSSYNKNLNIALPASLGQRIMEKYYEDETNFQDSYHFTKNVLPGLYFRCTSGMGTFIKVYVGTLNIFFHYQDSKTDSIYSAMSRFAATPEVIQSTRFTNIGGVKNLISPSQNFTYLKTPAGLATEVTLPVDDIFDGEHAIDSISSASITFTRYNKMQSAYQFGIPAELLMIRKAELYDFFRNRSVTNNRTSYTTSYNASQNCYTFSNISRLLSYCKHEKVDAVRKRFAQQGHTQYTDEEFRAEEAKWMQENPDWDKVVLVPVVTSSTETSYGNAQVSVNHDMGLNSIRLVGGTTPLKLQIVYSRFSQE